MGENAVIKRVVRKDGKEFKPGTGIYVGNVTGTIRNPQKPESLAYIFNNFGGCINVDLCEDILNEKEIIEKEIQRRLYVISHRLGPESCKGDNYRKDELNKLLNFIKTL